jgi:hypothetical protein
MEIAPDSLAVRRTIMVELPCRLIQVTRDMEFWIIYAIGATGSSDHNNVKEYKTHLYKLAVPMGI